MRRFICVFTVLFAGDFLLADWWRLVIRFPSAPESIPATEETQGYRGRVAKMNDDGSIEIEQLEGYDYNQQKIVFIADENTEVSDDLEITEDAFVEVTYGDFLTASEPPQVAPI